MTVLEEMGQVMRAVPGPRAPAEDVARWYECKARLLEHLAAAGGPDADRLWSAAVTAHHHAAALRSAA